MCESVNCLVEYWSSIKSMNSDVSLSFSQLRMFILKSPNRTISFFPGLDFLTMVLESHLQIHSQIFYNQKSCIFCFGFNDFNKYGLYFCGFIHKIMSDFIFQWVFNVDHCSTLGGFYGGGFMFIVTQLYIR